MIKAENLSYSFPHKELYNKIENKYCNILENVI